jgi:hypothetical protein
LLWSPGLQLLYPFENQANDYSGNARHGTVNGSGVYATRPNGGRCLYFDGTGDYVETPSFGLSGTVVWFAADVRCKLLATDLQNIMGDNARSATIGYLELYRRQNLNDLAWRFADGTSNTFITIPNYFQGYDDAWVSLLVVCDYAGKKTYAFRDGCLFYTSGTMSGVPAFPSTTRVKYLGQNGVTDYPLTAGYLAHVQLGTLATMPPVAQVTANANRVMLGMHPIW